MKIIIACGAATAAMLFGAPTAAADINISGINIGNQGNAEASFGNVAIATGSGVASATGGIGNVAIATNQAEVLKSGPGSFNLAAGVGPGAQVVVGGNSNFNAVGAGPNGEARLTNGNGNIVFAGRDGSAQATNTNLSSTTAFCGGTATSAQSVRIVISAPCGG